MDAGEQTGCIVPHSRMKACMSREPPARRSGFRFFHAISTRWADNDVFGHVNNATYYSYFDTAVCTYLVARKALEPVTSPVVGVVIDTGCRFHAPIAFPDRVHVGVRVEKLGSSSVRYAIGVFRNDEETASADGHFVHVYVDRATMRPQPIPEYIRQALADIAVDAA